MDFYSISWQLSFHSLNSFQAVIPILIFMTDTLWYSLLFQRMLWVLLLRKKKSPNLSLSHVTFKTFILYLWTIQHCGIQIIKSNWRLLKNWASAKSFTQLVFQAGFKCNCNFLIRNSPYLFSFLLLPLDFLNFKERHSERFITEFMHIIFLSHKSCG